MLRPGALSVAASVKNLRSTSPHRLPNTPQAQRSHGSVTLHAYDAPRSYETFICPKLRGRSFRRKAKACPECGSDEKTGWSKDTIYDGHGDRDRPRLTTRTGRGENLTADVARPVSGGCGAGGGRGAFAFLWLFIRRVATDEHRLTRMGCLGVPGQPML